MEQSSLNIWNQICESSRKSISASGTSPEQVVGICFDATCSLVVWDVDLNEPVSVVLPEDRDEQNLIDERNVILWADHRSKHLASQINNTKFENVLKYVGGKISPEMELPKIKFLLENQVVDLENNKGIRFFDLADWLTFMCTGNSEVRSQCTTTCKWGYVFDKNSSSDIVCGGWNAKFLEIVKLDEILKPINRIGSNICKIGSNVQFKITATSASQLGLSENVSVAIPVIDAHSGGIGMVGAVLNMNEKHTKQDIPKTLVLIAGTSSCHMIVSEEPVFIDGVWGPFYNSMTLDMYLSEGGQTFCGAALDYIVESHPQYYNLIKSITTESNIDVEDISIMVSKLKRNAIKKLENLLEQMKQRRQLDHIDLLTSEIHISPHFNGCRSPLADPEFRGVISGLSVIPLHTNKKIENLLKDSNHPNTAQQEQEENFEQLAILYLATIQALAYGTKHIMQEMVKNGHVIDRIFMCGGLSNNELFVKQHANITEKPIYRMDQDSMLLGCGVLSSVACGAYNDMYHAMENMCHLNRDRDVLPEHNLQSYHEKKFNVYMEIIKDFIKYREMMK